MGKNVKPAIYTQTATSFFRFYPIDHWNIMNRTMIPREFRIYIRVFFNLYSVILYEGAHQNVFHL